MAIHELDELTDRRVAKLEAKHGRIGATADGEVGAFQLADEPEQTAVRFDIPTKSGGIVTCNALVHHDGETVVNVILPPHFRDYAPAAGLDRFDLCFEAFLEAMAKMAFARTATHLTCRLCGGLRSAAPAKCGTGSAHDWVVAK